MLEQFKIMESISDEDVPLLIMKNKKAKNKALEKE